MTRLLERRLERLEAVAVAVVGIQMPAIFVSFVSPDGAETSAVTATVDGRVWHREPDELEEAFCKRVRVEATSNDLNCSMAVLDWIWLLADPRSPQPQVYSDARPRVGNDVKRPDWTRGDRMPVILALTALVSTAVLVSGCVQSELIVLKNPDTGEMKECSKNSGASLFPIAQTMIDNTSARSCAAGYQAAGWIRMN